MKEVKTLIAEYITKLKLKTGLNNEAISGTSNIPESTVKNLCTGKTENPGIVTVAQVVYALGGSLDEMFNQNKSKDELNEMSVLAIKEIYENQLTAMKESYDEQTNNVRNHYEQHHQDLVDNFEKRLTDKREMNEQLKAENQRLQEQLERSESSKNTGNLIRNCIIGLFVICVIAFFILEYVHPEKGWLRF